MKMPYCLALFISITLTSLGCQSIWAFNAVGHRLIAAIAVSYLKPETITCLNRYNHALDHSHASYSLINAATWLDEIRFKYKDLAPLHYIDKPFTQDGSFIRISIPDVNAVSAVYRAVNVLNNPEMTSKEKGFQLRILLHVVGDLHQPLHCVTRVTKALPEGDKGGNLFYLGPNRVGKNLHTYWDNGGGLLKMRKKPSPSAIRHEAKWIAKRYPCDHSVSLDPQVFASESYQLATNVAYSIREHSSPDFIYQYKVRRISEKQLALAGCRLALILNGLNEGAICAKGILTKSRSNHRG